MPILIDGYNVLFAQDDLEELMHSGKRLHHAREALLRRLSDLLGEHRAEAVVVFDAVRKPVGVREQRRAHGMQVHFANRAPDADTVIEEMVRDADPARQVLVVTNDNRLRDAAAQRKARTIGVGAFLSALEQGTFSLHGRPEPEPKEKLNGPSPEESARWVEEFKHLADDPEFNYWLGAPGMDDEEFM
jgi:predicted RNA-binding protein with PIN domain